MAEVAGSCPPHLLQAARQLMAEHGYAAMTMRQLAGRVGLLPGSLYHHVACKQDLLLTVLLDIVERRIEAWEKGGHTRDLAGFVGFLLQRQCSHPDEEVLLRHEARFLETAQRNWLDKALARLSQPLVRIIEGSSLAPDGRQVCATILAVIDAAGSLRTQGFDETWIEAQALEMCRMLTRDCFGGSTDAIAGKSVPTGFDDQYEESSRLRRRP